MSAQPRVGGPGGAGTGRGTRPTRRTARTVALEATVAIDRGARANSTLATLLAGSEMAERDRALATELVYGACRMRRACDWLTDRHLHQRSPHPLDPEVRSALRLGAYQLAWMRVPSHAAVSATVDEVAGPGRSLVNAVLRHLAAELEGGRPRWPDLPTELSYPDWVMARLATDLGPAQALAAMKAMNDAGSPSSGEALRADGYRQDVSSQEVAAYVGATSGELVLDVCAAPGGKATWMASSGAEVVACDLSVSRARLIGALVGELDLPRVDVVAADGVRAPFTPGTFDRVLLDAPCSGLGALRRRPDARWRINSSDLPRLAELQRGLISACVPLLRPGGTLVYSVCTLTSVETVGVAEWVAGEWPSLTPLAAPPAPWVPAGVGALRLPQEGGDGMFVAGWRVGEP